MKKTFLAKRNALLSGRGVSWGAVALGLVILLFLVRVLAPGVFWSVFAPFFSISNALDAQTHTVLQSMAGATALAHENDALQNQNATLAAKNQILTQKLADVTKLLGVTAPAEDIPGVLAGVVARPPESPYDTLVVAAGTSEGAVLGMEAFGSDGVPLGVVSGSTSHFSRVTLFSAPGTHTDGWIGHATTPITLIGAGGGTMIAHVLRTTGVRVGDLVFVPGPGRLPVGKVIRIDGDPLSPSVTLRIAPATNVFSTPWVVLRATGTVPIVFATSTPL